MQGLESVPVKYCCFHQTGRGILVADIANPFFGSMARFIEDEAILFGYTVIIGSSDEDCEKSSKLIDTMLNRQVDGFIIAPTDGCHSQIENLVQNEVPFVLIDRYLPGINSNYVILDNFNASNDAVRCLIEKGFKKIGMVAYKSDLVHMNERVRGYKEAMEANGLKNNILVKEVRHTHIEKDMDKVLKEILHTEKKADALLFATNTLSLSGLYYIMNNQIKVPDDLAVVGFDGNEAFDFFYSPLTYIQQPLSEMARESVRILVEQINESRNVVHIMMPHQLIERQSCG